jgi:hypothetical protein
MIVRRYHLGIIDYLQIWNTNKIAERAYKRLKKLSYKVDISCIPPPEYSERYIKFMIEKVFIKNKRFYTKKNELNA